GIDDRAASLVNFRVSRGVGALVNVIRDAVAVGIDWLGIDNWATAVIGRASGFWALVDIVVEAIAVGVDRRWTTRAHGVSATSSRVCLEHHSTTVRERQP